MSAIINLLARSNWIMLNKNIIRNVGLEEAIMMGELCSEYNYWQSRDLLKEGEWFFTTRENIKDNTGLSEHKQRCAIETLKNLGVINVKLMGLPAKTYYSINPDRLSDIIENPQITVVQKAESLDMQKTAQQGVKDPDNINNNKDNNKVNGIPFTPAEPASRSHSKIYASKQADKLKDDLGGLGEKDPEIKKEKPKKKTLYQKCIDAIDDPTYGFTDNVKKALTDYLSFVLQPAEKSVKGINQWTYKLKALVKFSTDPNEQEQIISKSLQLGYYGFFALDYYKQKRGNRPPVDDVIIEHRTQEEKEADLAERKLKFNGY